MKLSFGNNAVLCELDQRGVATITLNRPEVNNAYNGDMLSGVHEAMDSLSAEPSLRIVVLQGAGKHFQAGADLSWISSVGKTDPRGNEKASRLTAEAVRRLNELSVPTIALVKGACIGGGTGIISACDIVIASESAIFGISEARWGLVAGIIFPQLVQAIGARNLRRYALTCEKFGAQTAKEIGLVHEVCPDEKLQEVSHNLIDAILMNGPQAVSTSKTRILKVAEALLADDLFDVLVNEHAQVRQSAEAAEGTASFKEKRQPSWYRPRREGCRWDCSL